MVDKVNLSFGFATKAGAMRQRMRSWQAYLKRGISVTKTKVLIGIVNSPNKNLYLNNQLLIDEMIIGPYHDHICSVGKIAGFNFGQLVSSVAGVDPSAHGIKDLNRGFFNTKIKSYSKRAIVGVRVNTEIGMASNDLRWFDDHGWYC